jgi:6-phosphofructokinase
MTLSRPPKTETPIRRVAILFAGGPAPAANAVISTAANSFLRNDIQVVGIKNGYSRLVEYSESRPLELGRDWIELDHRSLRRTRNSRGILIGTARTNPGRDVSHPSHLTEPERVAPLRTVYQALRSLNVDALVSIVHLPKTIDNDYSGIDFTFGYFTAVDTLANEIRSLLADAEAGRAYYLTETMGRSAGWLAYGAAMAGEASLVISVEDLIGKYRQTEESVDPATGQTSARAIMNVEEVVKRIVATMRVREESEGKEFGVIVMAEGLAEYLPMTYLHGVSRDEHGHIAVAQLNLSRLFSRLVAEQYHAQTGRKRKITGLQLGYEARCAQPHAFDVMLGSQLGVGAYRALVEERLDGVMVSVSGQFKLNYVPFGQLIDPETLVTMVRYVEPGSDFHRLARYLETYINE